MGTISITNIRIHTQNGVFPEEKKLGQQLAIDVFVDYPIEEKVKDDELNTTISYAEVYQDIVDYAQTHSFNLIESLANGILNVLLQKYINAQKIKLNIRKYSVPIDGVFDDVQISVSGKPSEHVD